MSDHARPQVSFELILSQFIPLGPRPTKDHFQRRIPSLTQPASAKVEVAIVLGGANAEQQAVVAVAPHVDMWKVHGLATSKDRYGSPQTYRDHPRSWEGLNERSKEEVYRVYCP